MLLFLLLFIFFSVIQWLNVKDIVSFVCQHLNAFSIKLIFFFSKYFFVTQFLYVLLQACIKIGECSDSWITKCLNELKLRKFEVPFLS